MQTIDKATVPSQYRPVRVLLVLVAVTAILSILYGVQFFLGGPIRPRITSPMRDIALFPTGSLQYARWTPSGWATQPVDDVGNAGEYNTLVLDGSGNPHLSYYDAANRVLKYARWTGSAWDVQMVDSAGNTGPFTSLALDSRGRPHISYCLYDSGRGVCEALRYAYSNGSAWITETVDSAGGAGAYTSLALDSADSPHIVYEDAVNKALKYAQRSQDGTWTLRTVDSTPGTGEYASMALAGGMPQVSYYDHTRNALKYAYFDGSNWISQTVDARGNVGQYTSLALDRAARPHISYYDSGGENLRYAHLSGTVWLSETVDSAAGVGQYTSLALDSSENPHISYYDATNKALKYARWTGSSWDIQTVNATGTAGQYTSLVLDSSGNPHISYYASSGLISAGTEDGVVYLWDVRNNWALRALRGHTGPVVGVAFAPSGLTLYSASRDGTLRLWNVASGQPEKVVNSAGAKREPLVGLALSFDGTRLATIGEDSVVRVWDVATWQTLVTIGPNGSIRRAAAFSHDGTLLAVGDGADIQIMDARTGQPLRRLKGHWQNEVDQDVWLGNRGTVTTIAFSPDGQMLASGGADSSLAFWNLQSGQVSMLEGHWTAITKVVLSETGKAFLSSSTDGKVLSGEPGSLRVATYKGHLGSVDSVAFGWSEDTIVTAGEDGTIRAWETLNNSVTHLEWIQPGLMPIWGTIVGVWMLLSGLLGLVCLYGMWRGYVWSHVATLALYLLGPVVVLGPTLLEVPSYPVSWLLGLQIAWPILVLAAWYAALLLVLLRGQVAMHYEAPRDAALAQQLMARRRTLQLRFGVFAAAVWFAVLVFLYAVLRAFTLDIPFMQHYFMFIMAGAGKTLYISALSITLAVVLALLGALGRISNNPIPNGLSGFYVSLIRGTPLLVQLYIWYLGLPQLGITLPPEPAGILALGVNYGAYMTEIFRAGIQAIGKGQHEAAHALGMTPGQTFRHIVLPQAFRIVIPPIGNEFIAMMKDSSLISIFGVWELTFRAQKIGRQYFRSIETFLIAAAFYWVLTVIFQFLQGKLETYMARSERK